VWATSNLLKADQYA